MPVVQLTTKRTKGKVSMSVSGPNTSPIDYFTLFEHLPSTNAKIAIAFDISGSQCCRGGESLIRYMKNAERLNLDIHIYPFGELGEMKRYDNISQFNKAYSTKKTFSSGTSTDSINAMLSRVKEQNYKHIVIIGDGEFNHYRSSSAIEIDKFLKALETEDLSTVHSLTLLFSPHTTSITIDKLKSALYKILLTATNALTLNATKLPFYEDCQYNSDQISRVLTNMSSSVSVDKNHLLVGTLFSVDKRMTYKNIKTVIKENYPKLIDPLYEYMMNIIMNQQLALKDPTSIYSKLHNVLKILDEEKSRSYIDRISYIKSKDSSATAEQKEGLTELLNRSFSKDDEVEELINKLDPYCIGYGVLPNVNTNTSDILSIIKDGSCMSLKKFADKTICNIQFIPRRKNEVIQQNIGMLILRPLKESDTNEYRELLRYSLTTFFLQFGNFIIDGVRTYILGLIILFSEAEIPKVIHKSIEGAIFDDYKYTYKTLKFDIDSDTLDIPNALCSPGIMRILATAFVYHTERTIGKINDRVQDRTENEIKLCGLIDVMEKFIKIQMIKRIFNKFNHSIDRTISKTESSPENGDLVFVKSWENEVYPNLPAVGQVHNKRKSKRKKRLLCDIKYFDCGFYTDNSDIRHDVPLCELIIIHKGVVHDLYTKINKRLVRMRTEGDLGIYNGIANERGDQMRKEAKKTDLRMINDSIICEIIGKTGIRYKKVPIKVPVPKDFILDIVKYGYKLNDHMVNILKSGSNLTKNDIILGSSVDMSLLMSDLKLTCFIYKENEYTIKEEEIQTILKMFGEKWKQNKSIASNIKCCPICSIESHQRNFTFFNGCHHDICLCCKNGIDKYLKYEPGSIVEMRYYKCPLCRHINCNEPQICTVLEKYNGSIPDKCKLRFCSVLECGKLFETELHCGMDESHIPDKCEDHMDKILVGEVMKKCPKCGHGVIFGGGCDYMECICGSGWCYQCLHVFQSEELLEEIDTIMWKCGGPCDLEYENEVMERY